jgi:hypothetical protein
MGSLFQADGELTRFRTMSCLGSDSDDFRRRATECRELASTCLTAEAECILAELADELDREAAYLERSPHFAGGIEADVGA